MRMTVGAWKTEHFLPSSFLRIFFLDMFAPIFMIVYSSLLHSITYGSSDESREDPGKPSSCFFAGKNMLICENWSLRLLLGESQRFMDAVVVCKRWRKHDCTRSSSITRWKIFEIYYWIRVNRVSSYSVLNQLLNHIEHITVNCKGACQIITF